jgi:hypothetical protein
MNDSDIIKALHTLRSVEPDKQWLASSRQQLVRRIADSQEISDFPAKRSSILVFFNAPVRLSLAGSFLAFASIITLASAAQQSLPGEPLYSVKRTTEQVERAMPADEATQTKRSVEFAQRRVEELEKVAANSADTQDNTVVQERAASYRKTLARAETTEATQESARETGVIKESAETLAMVLSESKNGGDFTAMLRATIANRLAACQDEEIRIDIQNLLAEGDVASLVEANELSVRCTE